MTIKEIYRENIIAHWDFRKGSLSDQSENGFGITTLTGSPEWIRNKFGRALGMYGSERVTLGKILGTSSTISALTVVIRVRPQVDATLRRILCKFSGAGTTAGNIILDMNVSNPGDIRWGFANNTPTHELTVSAAGVLVNNKEQIIIATFDGSTNDVNAFVDGVQVIDSTFTLSAIPLYDYNWFLGEDGGIDSQQFKGDFNEAMIINAALTPLQASQLYTEMKKEAHLNYIPTRTVLPEGELETSVVGAWDMNIRDDVILDITGGGNNGIISGTGSTQVDGVFGKALQFPGVDNNSGVQIQEDALIDNNFDGGGAVEAWVLATSDGGTSLGRIADKTQWFFLVQAEAAGFCRLWFRKTFGTVNGDWKTTNLVFPLNTPVHVIISYDDGDVANNPTFFINGTEYTMGSGMDETATPVGTVTSDSASDLWIGSTNSNNGIWGGWIDTVKLHNKEFTQAEAQIQYEKGKSKLNYYAEGKDWNVSTGNVTAGELENTGWNVSTGTWQVDDSTNEKQITCVSMGDIFIPSEQAFGTWEFDYYKAAVSTSYIHFIAQGNVIASIDSYSLAFTSTERIQQKEWTAGGSATPWQTAENYIPEVTWFSCKITRSVGGIIRVYIDSTEVTTAGGGSGAYPNTDTSYNSSVFMVLDMVGGDAVRNFRFSPVIQ